MAASDCTHSRTASNCDSCRTKDLTAQVEEFRELYDRRLARLTANLREDLADEWAARNRDRERSDLSRLPLPDFLRDPRREQSSSDSAAPALIAAALIALLFLVIAGLAASQGGGGKKGRDKSAGPPPAATTSAAAPSG